MAEAGVDDAVVDQREEGVEEAAGDVVDVEVGADEEEADVSEQLSHRNRRLPGHVTVRRLEEKVGEVL